MSRPQTRGASRSTNAPVPNTQYYISAMDWLIANITAYRDSSRKNKKAIKNWVTYGIGPDSRADVLQHAGLVDLLDTHSILTVPWLTMRLMPMLRPLEYYGNRNFTGKAVIIFYRLVVNVSRDIFHFPVDCCDALTSMKPRP
ncbi:hypothetical protein LTR67_000051 [Exophiala xenobiotica]